MDGIIDFVEIIENRGFPACGQPVSVRHVWFPGNEQLSIWGNSGMFGENSYLQLTRCSDRTLVLDDKTEIWQSGSSKIILNTGFLPYGEYELRILNTEQTLLLKFAKRKFTQSDSATSYDSGMCTALSVNECIKSDNDSLIENTGELHTCIQNNDSGTGIDERQIRSDAERILTDKFQKLRDNKDVPELLYHENGRSGYVEYTDEEYRCKFWYEFAGGECKLFIDVPAEVDWQKLTGIPLSHRRPILLFIASKVVAEKANSWRFEIHDREIAFY